MGCSNRVTPLERNMTMIKLITHNAGNYSIPDDTTLPWILEFTLRAPEFMSVAFIFMYGNEYVKIRASTEQELIDYATEEGFYTHPRKLELKIYCEKP